MLISEVLSMDISASDVLAVTGLTVTKRTISKARRNLGDARQKVGYDTVIRLSQEQQQLLTKAKQRQDKLRLRERQHVEFQKTLQDYVAAEVSERTIGKQYKETYQKYQNSTKVYDQLEQKLKDVKEVAPADVCTVAVNSLDLLVTEIRSEHYCATVTWDEYVIAATLTTELLKKLGGYTKLPHKLIEKHKKLVQIRKTMNHVKQGKIETNDETV